MKTTPTRPILLALALAAVALPSFAAPAATRLSTYNITHWYNANGTAMNSNGGGGGGNPANLFNGDFGDYTLMPRCGSGGYVVIDLSEISGAPDGGYKVTEIKADTSGSKRYSIYYTTAATRDADWFKGDIWTAVPGAEPAQAAGTVSYPVGALATAVKYVFVDGTSDDWTGKHTAEIQVWGYEPVRPNVISKYDITHWYNANGTAMNSNGGGGGGNPANLFNGDFGDYTLMPRCGSGGYVVIDLTENSDAPDGGYWVTEVKADTSGSKRYSIYYTSATTRDADWFKGDVWTAVPGAEPAQAAGTVSYPVGALATAVKYVFVDGTSDDWTGKHTAEIQVLGMDPADIDCTHPSWTEWAEVANSATCTEKGLVERFCTVCNERQTLASDNPPLGHHYQTHLTQAGTATAYGSGYIDCSRCDFRIDFPNPVDLITKGGAAIEGKVQFTDLSVSSENHPEWGSAAKCMIDNNWTWEKAHLGVWVSQGGSDQYADFKFGTEVDLTSIDFSIRNENQTIQFFSVDETSGEETLVGECRIVRDPTIVTRENEGVQYDTVIEWQRQTAYFFETQVKHLRVRRTDEETSYSLWNQSPCFVIVEMHPYGTVVGAGKKDPGPPMFLLMQ